MDGHAPATMPVLPPWISPARKLPLPRGVATLTLPPDAAAEARARATASLYMQRDLSDAALQQPAEPTYLAGDLEGARQEGFAQGHAAGHAEAEESRAAFETIALGAIAGAMAGARSAVGAVAEAAAAAFAKTVIAAMNVTMPAMIAGSALSEAAAMIDCIMPGLAQEPEIRMEVAPDLAAGVAAVLDRLNREDRVRIIVAGVAGLAPGAAKIAWSTGQASRQPEQIWRQIMDALCASCDGIELQENGRAE